VRNQYLLAAAEAHRAASELDRLLGTGAEEALHAVSTPR
jgi:cobalt-zinc-cadmium efflux system outer membrane protein